MNHETASALLDRLLDCTLQADERDAVAIHLASCADCQAQLATVARLRTVVRVRLAAVAMPPLDLAGSVRASLEAREPAIAHAPAATPAAPRSGPTTERSRRWAGLPRLNYGLAGAIGVAVLVFAMGGWMLRTALPATPGADIAGDYATQHLLFARDDQLLEVQGDATAVARWFRDRLPFPVVAPTMPGYELQGGRLVAIDGQRAAQVVYENEATKRYVSLILAPSTTRAPQGLRSSGSYRVGRRGDVAVVTWPASGIRMALVAPLSESELVGLAKQLTSPQP
jgi:anti-sigma factor RsiW